MIIARLIKGVRILSPSLPKIGETIFVPSMGHAVVEALFHTDRDNFIRLQWQETLLGVLSQELSFAIEPIVKVEQ